VARNTHDEYYHWSVVSKLKRIPDALKAAEKDKEEKKEQTSLEDFESLKREPEEPISKALSEPRGEDRIRLIVDSRELPTAVARELTKLDVEVSGESLEIGDYIASEDVAIERKATGDFIQSLIDGRLFVQLTSLRSAYRRPVLIIEGEQVTGVRAVNPASIYGALASIAVRIQVPIIWTRNEEETANVLYRIARLEQIDARRPLRTRAGGPGASDAQTLEYILSGFPGIDTVISRGLLEEFGTLEAVFSADEPELQQVKGVGPKTAGRMRRLLTTEYPKTTGRG
jgi:Fanconi anemia group M protein